MFALLYNRLLTYFAIFLKSLFNQGRLYMEIVRWSGIYWFMILMSCVETRFHLSLTVMFWFREKYACVKSSIYS